MFEIIKYDRLTTVIHKHSTLYDYQFGNKKCFESIVLVQLVDQTATAIDNGDYALRIFFLTSIMTLIQLFT